MSLFEYIDNFEDETPIHARIYTGSEMLSTQIEVDGTKYREST